MANGKSFWQVKTLAEMDGAEWESLCDGCGRCCLVKLEDEDTGQIHLTDVACRLFDPSNCRCSDYARRPRRVKDCVKLTPENAGEIAWLPETCAYRLISAGKPLRPWHPLVSGDPDSVHKAGISVKSLDPVSEKKVKPQDWEDHVITLSNRAKRG